MSPAAPDIPELRISGPKRAVCGIIATLRNMTDGRMKSMHETGPFVTSVSKIAATCDALGPEWRIVSLSSPTSIFRDLQGTRNQRIGDGTRQASYDPRTAECKLLGKIKRLDLLAPLANPGYDVRRGRNSRGQVA